MAKGIYVGVDTKARKAKSLYIGVNGVARRVKKVYVGVNGVARLAYEYGGKDDPVTPTNRMLMSADGSTLKTSDGQYLTVK